MRSGGPPSRPSPPSVLAARLGTVIAQAVAFVESHEYASFDLFDALSSPVIDRVTRPFPFARRVAVQILKRSPRRARPILGIGPRIHTKTVSDMLSVYALQHALSGDERVAVRAGTMYEMLKSRALPGMHGVGWGLNFPYTTRFVDAKASTPNLFNTVNAAVACLDYFAEFGAPDARETLAAAVRFITQDLGIEHDASGTAWARYYPGQAFPIVNVNASVVALLLRAEAIAGVRSDFPGLAAELLEYVVRAQNPDGSWFYATLPRGHWIDGFHTGYVLDALSYVHELNPGVLDHSVLDRAVSFYVEQLFTSDGRPKLFSDHVGPLESQNCAQAIQTLARLGIAGISDTRALLTDVLQWTLDRLYDARGFFFCQRGRFVTLRGPYFRWSQTPMILALLIALQFFGQ